MIIHAVTPLLLEYGRDITSKQIAEAAGIAEGTIYRAFGDKESLIEAVIHHYLDPEPMRTALRRIDAAMPLETKIFEIVRVLRGRFSTVFRIMSVLGTEKPRLPSQRPIYSELVAECLAPDIAQLRCDPERVGQVIRLVTFSAAFPQLNDGIEFSTEELSSIVLYGVAGGPGTPQSPLTTSRKTSPEKEAHAL